MVMINKKQLSGFSLVELLVAMVVGLIIISGAFSLHSGTRKTQAVNEMQMDMVADARFAVEIISYDLRHAGMWGGTNKDSLIDCRSDSKCTVGTSGGDTPPADMASDCAPGWYYNLSRPVFATNNANPYGATCIAGGEGYQAGTDVLEVRYADSNVAVALLAKQAYVRSNFNDGRVFVGTNQPVLDAYNSSNLTQNHELHAFAYYISDFTDSPGDLIPSLRRASLVNAPSLQNQIVVSGVTDLQVQFGVDVNNDQIVDRYDHPNVITTDNNWGNVYAAKIWLLMRSDDMQIGVNTAKSFSIAGAPAAVFGGQDDYRYFMVTSVVNLRNLKQL